jgi:hypothetical protein
MAPVSHSMTLTVQGVWKTADITTSPVRWQPVTDFDAESRPVNAAHVLLQKQQRSNFDSGYMFQHRRASCG